MLLQHVLYFHHVLQLVALVGADTRGRNIYCGEEKDGGGAEGQGVGLTEDGDQHMQHQHGNQYQDVRYGHHSTASGISE